MHVTQHPGAPCPRGLLLPIFSGQQVQTYTRVTFSCSGSSLHPDSPHPPWLLTVHERRYRFSMARQKSKALVLLVALLVVDVASAQSAAARRTVPKEQKNNKANKVPSLTSRYTKPPKASEPQPSKQEYLPQEYLPQEYLSEEASESYSGDSGRDLPYREQHYHVDHPHPHGNPTQHHRGEQHMAM